jgi:hypothetical protein
MRQWWRYVFLVAWMIIPATMITLCIFRPPQSNLPAKADFKAPPENQIDGITYYRFDPCTNKMCFEARVGQLRSANASIGFFKTAAAREIMVKDLHLSFNQSSASQATTISNASGLSESSVEAKNMLGAILARITDTQDRWKINIDLSHPVNVTIDNFDCRVFDKDTLRISVKSKRAILNSGSPQIMLRGHVIITADGDSIESNCIRWDIQKQKFIAEGTYLLKRGENRTAGKGICFDTHLKIMDIKNIGMDKELIK